MTDTPDAAHPIPYGIPAPGHRLPAATRPGAVRLQIADLDRSLTYYDEVLGLSVLQRDTGRAVLGVPDGVALVELLERSGARGVPRRGRLGLYHFAILMPTRSALGAFLNHLRERGETFAASDHLVSEALYLHDPDGLGIEVYADRPRDAWRSVGGQLVMATEPLDAADVARSAEGVSWSGAPEGTRVGHVHLHVGDLDRAADFYHAALGLDKTVWSYPGRRGRRQAPRLGARAAVGRGSGPGARRPGVGRGTGPRRAVRARHPRSMGHGAADHRSTGEHR